MPRDTGILKSDLREASGLAKETVNSDSSNILSEDNEFLIKHKELRGIEIPIIRKAWFTTAHLLLSPGSVVADMGCRDGQMAFAMSVFNPHLHFIGIDREKKLISKAQQNYQRSNLEFRTGDATSMEGLEKESLDAIINSFLMHEIYSNSKYHDRSVLNALENQFSLLKPEGLMLLRDYPMPAPGDMILVEMPDTKGKGSETAQMSEPELLSWYSERARAKQDPTCHGFFMEELPPRFPNTRLFRLPYKWFYEFILRKDDRASFQANLHKEFAFFTKREYRKALRALGARVLYSSPHWDEDAIRSRWDGHFRLYQDDGTPMGLPPTSFIAVAQKVGEGRSLRVLERRPSNKPESRMKITAMRNERDGRIVDVVTRDQSCTNIMPYRIDENGELAVFIHESAPRCITNTVQRIGKNLDEKYWSGHMTEAFSVNSETVAAIPQNDVKAVMRFARDHLGMKPAHGALLENGPGIYPAPDYIDDHIATKYLRVEHHAGAIYPSVIEDIDGFSTKGRLREVNAQALLNSISVGLIPNAQLEIQIIALFNMLGIKAETWNDCPLVLKQENPDKLFDDKNFVKLKTYEDQRFKNVRGTAGQIRSVRSIFVEEGWVDGGLSGLGAKDMEFIISDESTQNKAVVLPLTRNANGTVMAGITMEYLPVPQRFQGNGLTVRAPSFDLPKEIVNLHQARKFIADKFGVSVNDVFKLGESYFCHPGVTPQRIFPFAVAAHRMPPKLLGGVVEFYPLRKFYNVLFRIMDWNLDLCSAYALVKAARFLGQANEMSLELNAGRQMMYSMLEPGAEKFEDMTGLAATKAQTASASSPSSGSGINIPSGFSSSSGKESKEGEDSGDSSHNGGEPVFISSKEEFIPKQQVNSNPKARSGGGSGGGGSRPKQQAESAKQEPRQEQSAPAIQQPDTPQSVVNFRSEPVFDSAIEEFVENISSKNSHDRLENKAALSSKSGT